MAFPICTCCFCLKDKVRFISTSNQGEVTSIPNTKKPNGLVELCITREAKNCSLNVFAGGSDIKFKDAPKALTTLF